MKALEGKDFYDAEGVFEQYLRHRARPDHPNTVIERPIIRALIGDPKGLDCLDLGCGYGEMGAYLLDEGVGFYHGIDPSSKMIALAEKQLSEKNVKLECLSIASFQWKKSRYDLIISRLVFHYIEDMGAVFSNIYTSLKKGGALIFSVEHPVMTSSMGQATARKQNDSWAVANYFRPGPRDHLWMGGKVTKYHRTIAAYFELLTRQGFSLTALKEGEPERENFNQKEAYERRGHLPRYLICKAEKRVDR